MTLRDVINEESRPMGHAFVLKMMLLGERLWEEEEPPTLDYKPKPKLEISNDPIIKINSKEKKNIYFTGIFYLFYFNLFCFNLFYIEKYFKGFLIKSKESYLVCLPMNRIPQDLKEKEEEMKDKWSIVKDLKKQKEKETTKEDIITILRNLIGINFEKEPFSSFLPKILVPFQKITYGKKIIKHLEVFFIEDPTGLLLDLTFVCSSLIEGKFVHKDIKNKPIISSFMWVDDKNAKFMVYPFLKTLF
jgi:hypothetical protein